MRIRLATYCLLGAVLIGTALGGGTEAPVSNIDALVAKMDAADGKAAQEAADALAQIGVAALPALVPRVVKPENEAVGKMALRALLRIGIGPESVAALAPFLTDGDSGVPDVAAALLGFAGPAASNAVPGLIRALRDANDDELRSSIADALGQIGPAAGDAVPLLVDALRTRDASPPQDGDRLSPRSLQLVAASALGRIGVAAVPALIEAGGGPDRDVCRYAAIALAQANQPGEAADPILRRASRDIIDDLKGTNLVTRKVAAFAVHDLGPAGKNALAALLDVLAHESAARQPSRGWEMFPAADAGPNASAYASLQLSSGTAMDFNPGRRIQIESNPEAGLAVDATYALGGIGADAAAAVPLLRDVLKSGSGALRLNAIYALGRIGPAASNAVPALMEVLNPRQGTMPPYMALNAAWALGKIGPAAKAAVPVLAQCVTHRGWDQRLPFESTTDSGVRCNAAYALARIGPAAGEAVPALTIAIRDQERPVRLCAAIALARVAPEDKDVAAKLKTVLRDAVQDLKGTDRLTQASVVWALGEMGPAARATVSALTAASKRTSGDSLHRAMSEAIKKIGPAVPAETLDLTPAEAEDALKAEARTKVAKQLTDIGPDAMVDELVRLGPAGLEALCDELIELGPAAMEPWFPMLAKQLEDGKAVNETPEFRAVAMRTMAAMESLEQVLKKEPKAMPVFALRLKDKRPVVRLWMLKTLGAQRGPLAEQAVPAIASLLKDEHRVIRVSAAASLGEIGPSAKEALPALVAALQETTDDLFRRCIVNAVEKIESTGKAVDKAPQTR